MSKTVYLCPDHGIAFSKAVLYNGCNLHSRKREGLLSAFPEWDSLPSKENVYELHDIDPLPEKH